MVGCRWFGAQEDGGLLPGSERASGPQPGSRARAGWAEPCLPRRASSTNGLEKDPEENHLVIFVPQSVTGSLKFKLSAAEPTGR